jgi:hypothetical protein
MVNTQFKSAVLRKVVSDITKILCTVLNLEGLF